MADADEQTPGTDASPRLIQNTPLLDFSGVRSRAELSRMRLMNIGAVLVPEDLPDLLSGAECTNIGAVIPVPTGGRVERHVGQVQIGGDTLAAGDDSTILMLVGQVVVTPEVTRIGYRGLILVGQILLPKSAQAAIAGKVISQTGHVLYYEGAAPRVFMQDMRFSKAFLDLVEEPLALVVLGDCTFAADVTPELLRQKVRSMALIGDATVEDPALQPVVQYLANPVIGEITVASAADGSGS